MKSLRVALICNMKPAVKDSSRPADYYSECDSRKTVDSIASAIRSAGHTVVILEADATLAEVLGRNPVDLAFNIAEGFEGEAREARVPALLELLGIPYTGSGVLALALALDKAKSKQIFRFQGIPTPNFQLFRHADEPLDARLKFPLIVKPNTEGSGKGINASSVVADERSLRAQLVHVLESYGPEALVEEYIEGAELTVGILGADQTLPVLEVDFSPCAGSGEFFYSWRMKEYQGDKAQKLTPRFWCPARLDPAVTQAVQAVAWKAARALGTRDVARVDIRLSHDGIPYVLEVNPLPGMDPEESNLPIMIRAAGMSYEAFINRLVDLAAERVFQQPAKRQPDNSSIPLSHPIAPDPKAPSRALPGSGEQGKGQPALVRKRVPKEENLGR